MYWSTLEEISSNGPVFRMIFPQIATKLLLPIIFHRNNILTIIIIFIIIKLLWFVKFKLLPLNFCSILSSSTSFIFLSFFIELTFKSLLLGCLNDNVLVLFVCLFKEKNKFLFNYFWYGIIKLFDLENKILSFYIRINLLIFKK